MYKRLALTASLALWLIGSGFPSIGFAQGRVEGTVASTKLTFCDFKPGGCEGSLVLETNVAGKPGQMGIKVPRGTLIKKGNDFVYLPTLRGNYIAVAYVLEKGEPVAKSIEVLKTSKP
ncbi:hypothetical protein [Cupriavidus sp. CP313]